MSRHGTALHYAAALLFFLIATAVWFHGVVLHPQTRIACCIGDGTSFLRDYVTASAQHQNMLTFSHDAANGAPEGTVRAPASLLANAGLQTLVVSALRGPIGLVTAWNVFALLGLVGTAMAVFWLLRRLGCSMVPSLFGGYVIAFSPYALERLYAGHLSLMQNWVFVVVSAAVLWLRERRTFGRAAVVGATIGLAFYVSAYQGLLSSVAVLVFLLVDLARLPERQDRIRTLALVSFTYGACLVALAPLAYEYSREESTVKGTVDHSNHDLFAFAARISAYLVPSPRNPLARFTRSLHSGNLTEETLFIGYSTSVLFIVAVVLLFRRNTWLHESPTRWWFAVSLAVLAPVAFVLSLPPAYHAGPVPVLMPSVLLAGLTTFWRVYSRFGMLSGFAVALLASLALSVFDRRPGRWRAVAPLALFVAVLELLPGNAGAFDTKARPAWVAWLAAAPHGIVATYPMDLVSSASLDLSRQQFWYQALDHDPSFELVGLSSSQFRSREQAIRFVALDPSRPVAAGILATEGVRYVVIDDAAYRSEGRNPPLLDSRHYKLLTRRGSFQIYSVHAPRVDLAAVLHAHANEIAKLQGFAAPSLSRTGTQLEVSNPNDTTRVRLTGRALNTSAPRLLELRDGAGHVLARYNVPSGTSNLHVGPFSVPPQTHSALRLIGAGPGVVLSRLALEPLPAYSSG